MIVFGSTDIYFIFLDSIYLINKEDNKYTTISEIKKKISLRSLHIFIKNVDVHTIRLFDINMFLNSFRNLLKNDISKKD